MCRGFVLGPWRLAVAPSPTIRSFDPGPLAAFDGRRLVVAVEASSGTHIVWVDAESGQATVWLLQGGVVSVALVHGDLVAVGTHGRLGRFDRDATEKPLGELDGAARLDALLDDDWAALGLVTEWLRHDPDMEDLIGELVGRLPGLDERRVTVVASLGAALGDPRIVPGLVDRLAGLRSPYTRQVVVQTLAEIADARAIDALIAALDDSMSGFTAEVGLARIGTERAIKALARHIDARMGSRAWNPRSRASEPSSRRGWAADRCAALAIVFTWCDEAAGGFAIEWSARAGRDRHNRTKSR